MNDAVLKVSGLEKHFPSAGERLTILEQLDLEVLPGTTVSITGESGCGKSTLLNIIAGLESASGGRIEAGPYQVVGLDEDDSSEYRGAFLGLVFQFHYLLKDFTALENVMLPAYMRGMKKREALDRARSLLAEVKLEHRAHHFPSQMSGGERQRAAVARSLVNGPSLVLADEPTGNLDPANSAVVRDLLFSVVKKHGKTLILVTHDRTMASMTDISWRLEKGRLVRS